MLVTDFAQMFLAEVQDQVAEILFIQKGTAFLWCQEKMRCLGKVDILFKAGGKGIVFLCALSIVGSSAWVDVDLPADAAAVGASGGDAVKIKIEGWYSQFHRCSPVVFTIFLDSVYHFTICSCNGK